jgi:hypothetical protein
MLDHQDDPRIFRRGSRDYLYAHHPLGAHAGHGKRYERSSHAPHKAEDRELTHVDPVGCHVRPDAEQVQQERYRHYDEDVGEDKEHYTFHDTPKYVIVELPLDEKGAEIFNRTYVPLSRQKVSDF